MVCKGSKPTYELEGTGLKITLLDNPELCPSGDVEGALGLLYNGQFIHDSSIEYR